MPPPHVLLLEDDPAIARTVAYAFERAGLRTTHCLLVVDALRQLASAAPDALVLDIGLPDGSGLDVCRAVRASAAQRHLPVLMLSAHGEEIDRVLGLELGADDYVTKPFSPRELVARVRGLLRRSRGAPAETQPNTGGFQLDEAGQRASWQGQPLALTRREFGLLAELLRHPGRIRSRETLLAAVWGSSTESTDRTVDTHIKTLRAKLQGIDPGRDPIATHRGMGYAIDPGNGGSLRMHLGIRILLGFFLITGLAGVFVLRIFVAEVKPSVREVMEDMMVDTANLLAELAADDLQAGRMPQGHFAEQVAAYARRPVDARIWGLDKQTLDIRVYVTDARGTVVFDSTQQALGRDYSQWRDVARTLRGVYGARATREVVEDDRSSVLYVAAPVHHAGRVIGVLTVAKPVATVQAFIDRAERKILVAGLWLLALSAAVGVAVTLWVVASIRRLKSYANAIEAGKKLPAPQIPGELGELASAMHAMRLRVEGREYIEAYVRALTHELKSPLAAIRGAGELLQEPMPEPDRQAFTADVLQQTERLQTLVDRLLELSKLEQRQELQQPVQMALADFLKSFVAVAQVERPHAAIDFEADGDATLCRIEPALLTLALANLVDNAAAFAPAGSRITLSAEGASIVVQDRGPGVPDYAMDKLGQKFFSTVRPDGVSKGSGLGLAIVQQVMALHGGRMEVKNTAPGLRVTLIFPGS